MRASCRRVALDLVEVYFQIVHTRLPLLNPAQFRARLHFSLYAASQSRSHSPNTPPSASSTTTFLQKSAVQNDTHKPLHPACVLPERSVLLFLTL